MFDDDEICNSDSSSSLSVSLSLLSFLDITKMKARILSSFSLFLLAHYQQIEPRIRNKIRRRRLRHLRKKQQKEYERNKANSVFHQPYISPLLTGPAAASSTSSSPNQIVIPPSNNGATPVVPIINPTSSDIDKLQQQQQQQQQISLVQNLYPTIPTTTTTTTTTNTTIPTAPAVVIAPVIVDQQSKPLPHTPLTSTTSTTTCTRPKSQVIDSPAFDDQLTDYKQLQKERYLKQRQETSRERSATHHSHHSHHNNHHHNNNNPTTSTSTTSTNRRASIHSPNVSSPLMKSTSPRGGVSSKLKKSGGILFNKNNKMTETKYSELYFASKDGCLWINDQQLRLKGINWFGCETETSVVHGLWQRDYREYIDFMAQHHFNAIRIPFSLEMVLKDPFPTSISITQSMNTDMHGLRALSVLDIIIEAAGERGMFILLDLHSFGPNDRLHDGLWYNNLYSEQDTLKAWNILTIRYGNTWNVIGVDLKNEPFSATWNSGNPLTDWDKAINRIGSYIQNHGGNRWLIFGQGVPSQQHSQMQCCWGESFESEGRNQNHNNHGQNNLVSFGEVGNSTVQLPLNDKFVYSPHCYGPSVVKHAHFNASNFPANMTGHWDVNFGLLPSSTGRAVVVGEWGGRYLDHLDRLWMDSFVAYLQKIGSTDSFYWCLNPNSGDTGGLLKDDWVSPHHDKLDLLYKLCPHPTKIKFDKDTRLFIVSNHQQNQNNNVNSTNHLENYL
ncbi:hypothetical protein DFA_09841 [Cavenderia fasciculata]|uniref:Glycoside hydrolase family 5 domain-containing protein n=1 Tax=Cavenderia fasciculata TaxID=261658 RepID=F4QAW0_CACFS|nr:uncharacterized protein DFA_09841 [Cavenderia fasciculata]EGG15019.1 hypothetical protein DFA_09841 [Cavenderia fasciculata]|eukprot:XP_004351739.1 hypothetical protein DFA_09841 [Cavenderia fasciculata]